MCACKRALLPLLLVLKNVMMVMDFAECVMLVLMLCSGRVSVFRAADSGGDDRACREGGGRAASG